MGIRITFVIHFVKTQTNIKIKKLLPNESSFDILSLLNYFLLRKLSTSSGVIIAS